MVKHDKSMIVSRLYVLTIRQQIGSRGAKLVRKNYPDQNGPEAEDVFRKPKPMARGV